MHIKKFGGINLICCFIFPQEETLINLHIISKNNFLGRLVSAGNRMNMEKSVVEHGYENYCQIVKV